MSRGVFSTWARRVIGLVAIAYPLALLVVAIAFTTIGERWWMTDAALYLPRWGFGLPLPFVLVALIVSRMHRLLLLQLAAFLLLLFPLMGFVAPSPAFSRSDAKTIRVLSFNANSCYSGVEEVANALRAYDADIVLVQELFMHAAELDAALSRDYPEVQTSTQFLLASRFPNVVTIDPERIPFEARLRSPRFMQHRIETPIGVLAVYNVHPISPRGGLQDLRGAGLREELRSGRLLSGVHAQELRETSALRGAQIRAVAEMAAADGLPSVLAGDMNLPGLSYYLRRYLSDYEDGFRQAEWGFGYTFPDRLPWMRLDRILTSEELEVTRFEVGCSGISDHRCVVADLRRR